MDKMKHSFIIFTFCFIFPCLAITPSAWGPTPVEIGTEMFKFQCRINNIDITLNADDYVTRIQIFKSPKFTNGGSNDVTSDMQEVVRVDFEETSNEKTITWTDRNVEARARVFSGKKLLNETSLRIVIDPDAVDCSDEGLYTCYFYGNGVYDPDTQTDFLTADRYIQLTASPMGISDISAKPFLGNDVISFGSNTSISQCLGKEQSRTVFSPGTRIALNCTAIVGYPSQSLKWCRRRPRDMDFSDFRYTSILTQSSDTQLSTTCISVTTSLLFYDIESEDDGIEFACHIGSDADCSTSLLSTFTMIHVDENAIPASVGKLDNCLTSSDNENSPSGGPANVEALSTPQSLSTPWMALGLTLLITSLVVLAVSVLLFIKARKLQNSLLSDKEREKYQTLSFNRTSEGETITYETMTENTVSFGNQSSLAFDNNDAIYAIAR